MIIMCRNPEWITEEGLVWPFYWQYKPGLHLCVCVFNCVLLLLKIHIYEARQETGGNITALKSNF